MFSHLKSLTTTLVPAVLTCLYQFLTLSSNPWCLCCCACRHGRVYECPGHRKFRWLHIHTIFRRTPTEWHRQTRSTGTVQTSAKARLTSAAIWLISVNECPLATFRISQYGPVRKTILLSLYPDRYQNVIVCSLANCQSTLKIWCTSFWKFLRKVANKQTDRQTANNDDYTTPWRR